MPISVLTSVLSFEEDIRGQEKRSKFDARREYIQELLLVYTIL
jgi:hypothetical protein